MRHILFTIFIISFCVNVQSQSYNALLKSGVDSAMIIINMERIATIYSGEKFIVTHTDYITKEKYDSFPVYTKKGKFGYIDRDLINILKNEPLIKKEVDLTTFMHDDFSEHYFTDKSHIIYYKDLLQGVLDKDINKVLTLFNVTNIMEVASEWHSNKLNDVLHILGDELFSEFYLDLSLKNKKLIKSNLDIGDIATLNPEWQEYYYNYFPKICDAFQNTD